MQSKEKNKSKTKLVCLSLPVDLIERADAKARQNYQTRSDYIKRLIFLDTDLVSLGKQSKQN